MALSFFKLGIDFLRVTIYYKCVTKKKGRDLMSPATGRPPSKDPKRNDTRIRLTDSEAEKLNFCSKETGLTKADVIRKGIDMVYKEVTKK